MNNLLQATEQVDVEYHEQLRQSLDRHARFETDYQYIQNFIDNQKAVVEVLRTLARHRRLRAGSTAGYQVRELKDTIAQEIRAMEIALAHLTSAYRLIVPMRRFVEAVINPTLENAGTIVQRNTAVHSLNEFAARYATVDGLWNALMGHTAEVQRFSEMVLT
ncbi:uncharacterized protein FTOL_06526 [Fusarium torulosum]|uniref:Uncharacterized protein n=1 Tax=Fusarium torulosum TaxID=33205 RepID=A0AAE8M9K0_9HYPO|nr:uncharacterized protein FTOL_06526 [Fusarium torulosum]